MKKSTQVIIAIVMLATYFKFKDGKPTTSDTSPTVTLTAEEEQDARDFAQALIQRDYKCDKVTTFSTANFSGYATVFCDDRYEYKVSKQSGRWIVEPQ
ncbi:hypothetical protein RM437_07980 [Citrobacter werkmanii]|uniref:hypothetical protein n=1 Tax=Citrobacter werkmanii TaxID=67827 RepID=UPI002887D71B|nr:hypothetical protein [Citrobacter werkmanii]MDT0637973.1 hypothetical protein [Citrobacter werkmanii]